MRGGKRDGAGRKKLPPGKKLIPKVVYLSELDWMWVEMQKRSKGHVIGRLIEKEARKQTPEF
jgi:hypothetical protein